LQGRTVLVVEDEFFVAILIEDILQTAGFDVVIAGSSEEAIAQLASLPAAPIALITDIRLPDAIGWDVARRFRDIVPNIAVLYVSGDSGSEWQTQGVAGSTFLQKPFNADTLTEAVREILPIRRAAIDAVTPAPQADAVE